LTLRFKLFAAFFTLVITPLFLLGIAADFFVSGIIEQKYSRQAEITLRALSQSVDFLFLEMNKVTDSSIASKALQEVMNRQGTDASNLTSVNYLELNEIQRNFRDLLVNFPTVGYALAYTLNDERILRIYAKDNFTAMPFDEFKRQPLYQSVIERQGFPVWVGPNEFPQLTGNDPVFTQIRVVKDINSLDDKGILLVQIRNSAMDGIFRYFSFKQEKYNTRFFIVNDQGLILFDSSDLSHGRYLQDQIKGKVQFNTDYQTYRKVFAGEDSVISGIPLGTEKWQLISVTSWSSLSKETLLYGKWVAGIISLCLLLASVFIFVFVNRIARKINRIVRFMRRVENGELDLRVEETGADELFLLSKGFNSLISRVQELLGRVKREQEQKNRSEIRLLQAQIKPHFIFNTLESINALAVQNEGKKVSQMVLRLANILRISFKGAEEVQLRQEIEHLRSYLEIQQYRFGEVFEYEIEIPEELLDCAVQKLTLQPLVENCIQHAFEGLNRKGKITIRAEDEDNRILLTVQDNGIGIPNDVLFRFQYMVSDEIFAEMSEDNDRNPERRGLGVRSVADRIRIQYGREYGLIICSEVQQGTIIKCILPKYEPGDRYETKSNTG
jgi:two-component system sensor histidine kinase YesM